MQQKESEGEVGLIFRYYPDICLEGLMKAMTTPSVSGLLSEHDNPNMKQDCHTTSTIFTKDLLFSDEIPH